MKQTPVCNVKIVNKDSKTIVIVSREDALVKVRKYIKPTNASLRRIERMMYGGRYNYTYFFGKRTLGISVIPLDTI